MPFVALAALLGILAGLGCCLLTQVLPQPWPALATTSATWGLLVWLLLRVAALAVPDPRRRTAWWCSAGAASMCTLLVSSDAWLSPLSLAAAVLAGSLVGLVAQRTSAGRGCWLGVLGGLLLGEGCYGWVRQLHWHQDGVHYLAELLVGLLVCLAPARREGWPQALRALAAGALVTVSIAGACWGYDLLHAQVFAPR